MNIYKIMAGAVGLFSLALGLMAWFSPAHMQEIMGVSPNSVLGEHSMRGDFGAIFLASAVGCGLALFKGKLAGLKIPIIIYSLVLIGRLLSLALSGAGEGVFQPMIIEVVMISLCYVAYRKLSAQTA